MNTMKKLWLKLLGFLAGIGSVAGEIILDALRIGAKESIGDLVQIFVPIVLGLERGDLPGDQKREEALKMARNVLIMRGIEASGRVLNAALELAVLKLDKPKDVK